MSAPATGSISVVKVGTSSITDDDGAIDRDAIVKVCTEIAAVRATGHRVVLVTSAAIAAGLPALGMSARRRPTDARTLQAVSAVGQARLMQVYNEVLAELGGLVGGQVLLAPLDFMVRSQYLHARSTLLRLLELGVVPVVNENDAIADDEIRFGDNDRIAALVAQLLGAECLVILTDAAGVFTSDPRLDASASLIEEIVEVDQALERHAGGTGSNRGSGGMTTKLAAAKIAAWSGVRTVIAAADRERVVGEAIEGTAGVGTTVVPRPKRLPARKVWIAFAVGSSGRIHVDAGARRALLERGSSLLAAGVTKVEGDFDADEAVEVLDPDGQVIAKGLSRVGAAALRGDATGVVLHRDDLLVLTDQGGDGAEGSA
ncbi:MAG TPA: glutamate 5-kinase [Microthrixaceae bacterium]|nr:glutamate 5-kinase [Microthrixaceae bacterium]